jgi:hypothetical protein
MKEFKLDVEESKIFLVRGIICLVRFDGKKLYVRLGKADEKGNLELMPLSKEELKEQNIEETEQIINNEYFDVDIEESTPEFSDAETERVFREQQEKLKKKSFNLNDIEDAKRAKEIAEKAIATLEKPDANEEIQRLKDEKEDYKSKLEIVAQMNLERKKRELGAPDSITTPDELIAYEKGLKDSHGIPSGSAPLNQFQLGDGKLGFETLPQMIQWLRDNPSAENEKILNQLFMKSIQGSKRERIPEYSEDPVEKSSVLEVESNVMSPTSKKDPNIESDVERYNAVLRKRREEANKSKSD